MGDKLIELIFIAVIVSIFSSAIFELIKVKFLALGSFGRIATLSIVAAVAVTLILIEDHIPKFEAIDFTIPQPVLHFHSFNIQPITVTTRAPLLTAIIFGLQLALTAILDAFQQAARFRETAEYLRKAKVSTTVHSHSVEYYRSPLVLYPLLGLSYKVLVNGNSDSYVSILCMSAASFLGLIVSPLVWRGETSQHQVKFMWFTILFATALTIAALF